MDANVTLDSDMLANIERCIHCVQSDKYEIKGWLLDNHRLGMKIR